MKRASIASAEKRWDLYELPARMDDDTFVDVGCWAGGFLHEAVIRGAERAVGVDSARSPGLNLVLDGSDKIDFVQMDVFSPHWFSLPRFDWVLCAGLIYHVLNPVGLLHRLKTVMKDGARLFVETAVRAGEHPTFSFCAGRSFDDNASNWFIPTPSALFQMTDEIGLIHENSFMLEANRAIFEFSLGGMLPTKYLPRKVEYMNE